MDLGDAKPRFGVFEDPPSTDWDDEPDDDAGDVIPPAAVDMEILHPLEPHQG